MKLHKSAIDGRQTVNVGPDSRPERDRPARCAAQQKRLNRLAIPAPTAWLRLAGAALSLAAACLPLGCVGSGGSSGGGGFAAATSGGPVGSNCPQADQIACAPGATTMVRCTAGTWVSDGACDGGSICVETKSGQTVVATACVQPSNPAAAAISACVKANACLGVWLKECVNFGSVPGAAVMFSSVGDFPAANFGFLEVANRASCLANAADCASVFACFGGNTGACPSAGFGSCEGSVATVCADSGFYRVDCAKYGKGCSAAGGQVFCGSVSPCSSPESVTCQGKSAEVCTFSGNALVQRTINCGYMGATCLAGVGGVACSYGGSCTTQSLPAHCQGNHAKYCANGKPIDLDCAKLAGTCATGVNDPIGVGCTDTPGCYQEPSCSGNILSFCKGSSGLQTFDCAAAGMVCAATGDSCAFANF